jgi:PAS domain S-box-containing protein
MRVTALTVALWTVTAAIALTLLYPFPPAPAPTALLLAIVAAAIAESWHQTHPWGTTTSSFTLIELGMIGSVLLLPGGWPVLTVAAGVALAELRNRRPLRKLAFNVSSPALATATAVLVLDGGALAFGTVVVPGGPRLGTAALAVLAYVVVDLVTYIALIVALDPDWSPRSALAQNDLRTPVVSLMVGFTGIVLTHLLVSSPWMALLLLAVLVVLQVSARSAAGAMTHDAEQRSTRERLGALVTSASDGIVVADETGRVELVNPAAERLLGLDAATEVGRDLDAVLASIPGRPRRDVGPSRYDLELVDPSEPDGSRTVSVLDERLRDERDVPLGRILLVADVTGARRLERMREDVLARVSHELRTPLTPILGYGVLLARRVEGETMREAAEAVVRNARRLEDIVDQLLHAAARNPGDNVVLRRLAVADVVAVVSARVADARIRSHRSVTLLADDAAAVDEGMVGDLDALARLVGLLIDNAVLHTPDDTSVEVTVACDADDQLITIAVADHGPGLPAPLEELALPFGRRESSLRQRTGGLGLGLYRARQLSDALHAELSARQTPGGGCTMEVRLPLAAAGH